MINNLLIFFVLFSNLKIHQFSSIQSSQLNSFIHSLIKLQYKVNKIIVLYSLKEINLNKLLIVILNIRVHFLHLYSILSSFLKIKFEIKIFK